MELLPTLLIIDDEKHTREGLRRALQDSFEIYLSGDVAGARAVLETEAVDLVLTDLRLGGEEDGMKVLELCQAMAKPPVCLMMTAYGSVDTAVQAMRRGAYDYVTKPLNIDKLEMLLKRASRSRRVEEENQKLRKELDTRYGLDNLIGNSTKMVEVFDVLRQVAETRATVLVEGESGTGKELVARAIHNLSPRKKKPFVPVHCAALSEHLLESELFGHEKGAFTGAHERRVGRFEEADKGTVFLDEIGEIDAPTQVKLLRVLGERKVQRVGSNASIDVDVRLVAATNRNLREMVDEGTFREDLFYRIHVVRIELPPLRERREDIPLLAKTFLEEYCAENAKTGLSFSSEVEQALIYHNWPGNVRELRTAVEHAVVLCRGEEIRLRDLPQGVSGAAQPPKGDLIDTLNLEEMERRLIVKALEKSENNRTDAAKLLGISRRTLHRKLNEYQLRT